MADEPGEESWDKGLEQAFGAAGHSVLDALGARSRISLRDAPGDPSPLVRIPGRAEADAPRDDSRYQILGEIGRGGIGTVYKAHDRDLGRDVALKVLRADLAENDEVFQRFLEEAQIGGQLQHPGLVPVYGLGLQPDGRPSFAMKLVKGETLSALLRARPDPALDRRRFLSAFEQICQTVAYAHSRGVVHRDLKPSNVMVGAFGEVQVVDWGFAKVLGLGRERPQRPDVTRVATVRSEGASGSESQAGSVMGTPAYMPPEQALGHVEELDERSDVFALGAILCEILTGQPPYAGSGRDQLVAASQCRLDEGWKRLDASGADPELIALCRRCLSPLRRDRPRDAGEVAHAVEAHLHAVEERARQAEVLAVQGKARETEERARSEREKVRAAWERKARRRTLALAATVLLAVAVAGSLYLATDARAARRQTHASAAVFRAMEEANRLLASEDWTAARAAAENAAEFARLAGAAEQERAAHLLADVQAEAARADAAAALAAGNAALIDTLTEIRLQFADDFDVRRRDAAYAQAFASIGLEIDRVEVDEAARLIRARGETAAAQIAGSLHGWATTRRNNEESLGQDWRKLARIAGAADPDPWRVRLHDLMSKDALDELRALAASEEARDQHPFTLALVGYELVKLGDTEAAVAFLRDAALRHPDDFFVLFRLGLTLHDAGRPAEAARFLTAAVAARPRSAGAHRILAKALGAAGDVDGAVAHQREAVRLKPDRAEALGK